MNIRWISDCSDIFIADVKIQIILIQTDHLLLCACAAPVLLLCCSCVLLGCSSSADTSFFVEVLLVVVAHVFLYRATQTCYCCCDVKLVCCLHLFVGRMMKMKTHRWRYSAFCSSLVYSKPPDWTVNVERTKWRDVWRTWDLHPNHELMETFSELFCIWR